MVISRSQHHASRLCSTKFGGRMLVVMEESVGRRRDAMWTRVPTSFHPNCFFAFPAEEKYHDNEPPKCRCYHAGWQYAVGESLQFVPSG